MPTRRIALQITLGSDWIPRGWSPTAERSRVMVRLTVEKEKTSTPAATYLA